MRACVLLSIVMCACGGGNDTPGDAGLDAPGFYRTVPDPPNRDVDLLFVVDNSSGMLAEQQALGQAFPALLNKLQEIAGGLPNLHIGIASSDAGAAGATTAGSNCTARGDDGNLLNGGPGNTCSSTYGLQGTFISDVEAPGGRARNYTGNLPQLFTCMSALGNLGCRFEMHLESMYRVLQPGRNPGFYRPSAHLAVVVIGDEDDCSTEQGAMFGDPNAGLTSPLGPLTSFRCFEFGVTCQDDPDPRSQGAKHGCVPKPDSPYMYEVTRYADFLRGLKSGGAQVITAGIAGDFDPAAGAVTVEPLVDNATWPSVARSCFVRDPNDPDDGATPPVRLQAVLSQFPSPHPMLAICRDDLTSAMVEIGDQVKNAVGNPCIDAALADVEPDTIGLQPSCTVADVTDPYGPNRTATAMPACQEMIQPGTTACAPGNVATPCWCLLQEPLQCPATSENQYSLAIGVARGGASPGGALDVYCRTE